MNGHTCQRCGYIEHPALVIVEYSGELLYRCPRCGAYDWAPKPQLQEAKP